MKPFRSNFEAQFYAKLPPQSCEYEPDKFEYIVPATKHKYTPDFHVKGTNIYFETKGIFSAADRKKMLLIKQQYPDARFILVFMRNQPIAKNSKTLYSDWCAKNGIEYMSQTDAIKLVKEFCTK